MATLLSGEGVISEHLLGSMDPLNETDQPSMLRYTSLCFSSAKSVGPSSKVPWTPKVLFE